MLSVSVFRKYVCNLTNLQFVSEVKQYSLQPACFHHLNRPVPTLREVKPGRILHLVGLSEAGIEQFIENHVPTEKWTQVKETILKDPNLMSMCQIPRWGSTLCHVLQQDDLKETCNTYSRVAYHLITVSFPYHHHEHYCQPILCLGRYSIEG